VTEGNREVDIILAAVDGSPMDFERLYQTAGWIAVILASLPFVNGRTVI
jgi:hypothetical protein